MSNTINYEGAEYRIIEASPSKKYILAQKAEYPEVGRFGVFMDAPIDLFHVEDGQVEYIDHNFCPYDTLDGPRLNDIIWFEEQGFVKLCFSSMELLEFENRRIRFKKKKAIPDKTKHAVEKPLMIKQSDPEKEYIEAKKLFRRILDLEKMTNDDRIQASQPDADS